MILLKTLVDLCQFQQRINWQNVAVVPTMGNLHAGHLQLVKTAQRSAEVVIVSIFVNPLQFGPSEDFLTYPRTQAQDLEQLQLLHVDAVFLPNAVEIYPDNPSLMTTVSVPNIAEQLCGASRPGHFTGVATIVAKLFNLIKPSMAIFGQKDFQQLTIIKKMVQDLNFSVKLIAVPTVREADGLAMSSRNQYLAPTERVIAPYLYATLQSIATAIQTGNKDYSTLCIQAISILESQKFKVDYLEVRQQTTLQIPTPEDKDLIILAAAFLGKTRLIDNILI